MKLPAPKPETPTETKEVPREARLEETLKVKLNNKIIHVRNLLADPS